VDACYEEQMHSMSMNKYYVESRGGQEGHKKHAIRDERSIEKVVGHARVLVKCGAHW